MSRRLCLLGDSIAKGIVYDSARGRYVFGRDTFLKHFCRENGFELLDHAKFGCTIPKGRRIAETCADEFSGCNAVLTMFGGNDCDYDWSSVAADPDGPQQCKTPPAEFRAGYLSLISFIREHGGRPVMLGMIPVMGRIYFRWITRTNSADAIGRFLHQPEHIEHWNEMYNLMLCSIAKRTGVHLVDTRSPLLSRPDSDALYCDDGIHLTEKGQLFLWSSCADDLRSALTHPGGTLASPT